LNFPRPHHVHLPRLRNTRRLPRNPARSPPRGPPPLSRKAGGTGLNLIAAGTVEEKVLALQDEKRALLANVFEASDAAAAKLSLADLKSLLK
jgi:hypothetical protein